MYVGNNIKLLANTQYLLLKEEVVSGSLLLLVLDRVQLVDAGTEVLRVTAEGDIEAFEERIHAGKEALRSAGLSLDGRLSFKYNNPVGQVGGHDEVVLDDEGGLLGVHDEAFDDLTSDDTLLRVQVRAGFVDEVDVGGLVLGAGELAVDAGAAGAEGAGDEGLEQVGALSPPEAFLSRFASIHMFSDSRLVLKQLIDEDTNE